MSILPKKSKKDNKVSVADRAFITDLHLRQLKVETNKNFLLMAKLLKQIRDEKFWQILEYESFESYIAQPELGFDRTSVYRFIGIHEKFIDELNVPPVELSKYDYSKLDLIKPHITKENQEELLSLASGNSKSDLRESLIERKLVETKQIHRCSICGGDLEASCHTNGNGKLCN